MVNQPDVYWNANHVQHVHQFSRLYRRLQLLLELHQLCLHGHANALQWFAPNTVLLTVWLLLAVG